MIAGLLLLKNKSDSQKEFINLCFSKVRSSEKIKIDDIYYPISKNEKKEIMNSHNKYFKRITLKEDIVTKYEKLKVNTNISKIKKDLDLLKKKKSLFSKIVQIRIYMHLKLYGKVNSLINGILSVDSIEQFYFEEYSKSHDNNVTDQTIRTLLSLNEDYPNKEQLITFFSYLAINLDPKIQVKMKKYFDLPDRLSFVREQTKSFSNAGIYPLAWSFWIEKYSSEVELLKFLEKNQVFDKLKDNRILLGSLFSAFPTRKEFRKQVLEAFNLLEKSKSLAENDLALRLEKNERILN